MLGCWWPETGPYPGKNYQLECAESTDNGEKSCKTGRKNSLKGLGLINNQGTCEVSVTRDKQPSKKCDTNKDFQFGKILPNSEDKDRYVMYTYQKWDKGQIKLVTYSGEGRSWLNNVNWMRKNPTHVHMESG